MLLYPTAPAHRLGDAADAISAYHAITMRSLVELLRMRYCPDRYDFGLRYLDRNLPLEIRQQVEPLLFCGSLAELAGKQATAVALFQATLNDLALGADGSGFVTEYLLSRKIRSETGKPGRSL